MDTRIWTYGMSKVFIQEWAAGLTDGPILQIAFVLYFFATGSHLVIQSVRVIFQ